MTFNFINAAAWIILAGFSFTMVLKTIRHKKKLKELSVRLDRILKEHRENLEAIQESVKDVRKAIDTINNAEGTIEVVLDEKAKTVRVIRLVEDTPYFLVIKSFTLDEANGTDTEHILMLAHELKDMIDAEY